MKKGWTTVPLGKVIRHRKEFVRIDDTSRYKRCRVQLHAKGIVLRDIITGEEIKTKNQQVCGAGEFLVAEIDAKVGGFGVVPDELEGAIVSSHYFLFTIDDKQLDRQFLDYFIRTPAFREQVSAQGSTNYAAIRPSHVLEYTVPLPPLPEQRRIVAKVEKLATKIGEATALRSRIVDCDLDAFRNSGFRAVFRDGRSDSTTESAAALLEKLRTDKFRLMEAEKIKKKKDPPPIRDSDKLFPTPYGWEWVRLEDICSVITDGTHQTPIYLDEGRVFLSAQNVKPYRFQPEGHRYVSEDLYQSCIARAKPEKGDILMTRVGAMIGEAAIIDRTIEFAYYVSLCLIKPITPHVHVPYLLHWLNSPFGAASSRQHTLGRGHSQGNLNLNRIRLFVIPFPPLEGQRRIAAHLDELQAKVDSLKELQLKTQAELDALLPSVLDKAFKGEL